MAQLKKGEVLSKEYLNIFFKDLVRIVNKIPPLYIKSLNTGNFSGTILNTTSRQVVSDDTDSKLLFNRLIDEINKVI